MEIVTKYKCEYCNEEYLTKEECTNCEMSHIQPGEIVSVKYYTDVRRKKNYPHEITVKMSDGKEVEFRNEWTNG